MHNTLLLLCAVHSLFFGVFHLAFWKLFRWPETLAASGKVNSAITQILNLRITYIAFGVGVLCLVYPQELQHTSLGRAILGGMSVFWIGRTIEQFVFMRLNRPLAHAMTALFILGAIVFALPLFD